MEGNFMTPQPKVTVSDSGSEPAQQSGNGSDLIPVPLEIELGGRIRNISKPKHWYMAVVEMIKNSMDAIEEANEKSKREGWVEVVLEREKDLASLGPLSPVRHVTVRDNGAGFDETNFKSFCKPDSLYKTRRGGKGVGRLVCIQAFRQMQVGSVFRKNNAWKKRRSVCFLMGVPVFAPRPIHNHMPAEMKRDFEMAKESQGTAGHGNHR
jgi:hypothetical protein